MTRDDERIARLEHQYAELRDRVAAIEAAQSSLTRKDRARLAAVLPAVAGAIGSEPFIAREIAAVAAVRIVIDNLGLSVNAVGRLLRRGRGVNIGGYVVRRVGEENHAALWSIERAIDAPQSPTPHGVITTRAVGSST